MINNNSELSNNADVITEGMFSVFDNARWKKKDILSNVPVCICSVMIIKRL